MNAQSFDFFSGISFSDDSDSDSRNQVEEAGLPSCSLQVPRSGDRESMIMFRIFCSVDQIGAKLNTSSLDTIISHYLAG